MSGFLYNDYCYVDLAAAASSEVSRPAIIVGSVVFNPVSYTVVTSNSVLVTYSGKSFPATQTTTQNVQYSITRVYKVCNSVGPTVNYSGLELTDVITVSWLVVLVWVAAYIFKNLRIGVRGY